MTSIGTKRYKLPTKSTGRSLSQRLRHNIHWSYNGPPYKNCKNKLNHLCTTCIKFKWSRRKCTCVKCNSLVCKQEEIKLGTGIPICTFTNKQFPADNQQKCVVTSCQDSHPPQKKPWSTNSSPVELKQGQHLPVDYRQNMERVKKMPILLHGYSKLIHSFRWYVQNATIPCRSLELHPFLSVMYFFLPPFSTNYSSILSHLTLPSISWSTSQSCCSQIHM